MSDDAHELPFADEEERAEWAEAVAKAAARREAARRAAEQNQLPCSPAMPVAVALSGGGHRASLFGLGALMAMVDSGANQRVTQIASVSGGSIVNLMVARACAQEQCDYMDVQPAQFDRIARGIFDVIQNGVLTGRVLGLVTAAIFLPLLTLIVALIMSWLPSVLALPLFVGWLGLLMMRGLLIEAILARGYFGKGGGDLRLRDLGRDSQVWPADPRFEPLRTEHVFCCTDLIGGRAVHFSTSLGGVVAAQDGSRGVHTWGARDVALSAILRASVAFPGIPPRRFLVDDNLWESRILPVRLSGAAVFLADGAVRNNLGTQALMEDDVFHGILWAGDAGGRLGKPSLLLALDASAIVYRIKPRWFYVPGLAEVIALARQAAISNTNTVGPRLDMLNDSFARAITDGLFFDKDEERPHESKVYGPETMVMALGATPSSLALEISMWLYPRWLRMKYDYTEMLALDPDLWEQSDQVPVESERLRNAILQLPSRRHVWNRALDLVLAPSFGVLCEVAGSRKPRADALLEQDTISITGGMGPNPGSDAPLTPAAKAARAVKFLREFSGKALWWTPPLPLGIPTTLSAPGDLVSRRLVGRGYANTAVTLYMLGLIDDLPDARVEHEWLFDVVPEGDPELEEA